MKWDMPCIRCSDELGTSMSLVREACFGICGISGVWPLLPEYFVSDEFLGPFLMFLLDGKTSQLSILNLCTFIFYDATGN